MIPINELRVKQAEFEGARQEFKKEVLKLEREREKFLKLFSEDNMKNLTIDKFVIGKEKSFCYWLENRLRGLGNIHGATSFKFGIYYGKTKKDSIIKYRFVSKFGSDENEAFQNVKKVLLDLLNAGKTKKKKRYLEQ